MMPMYDLVALYAGLDEEQLVQGLLERGPALGLREIRSHPPLRHPHRDAGCRLGATELLRPYLNRVEHALVIFDREGCGAEHRHDRVQIEQELESKLARNGWGDRTRAIVLDPELEIWLFGEPEFTRFALGAPSMAALRALGKERGFWQTSDPKPARPKELVEVAARCYNIRRTLLYGRCGRSAPFEHCTDPAFNKLIATLRQWFPAQ